MITTLMITRRELENPKWFNLIFISVNKTDQVKQNYRRKPQEVKQNYKPDYQAKNT